MASRKADESPDDSQDSATVSELLSRRSRHSVAEELSSDALNPSVKKLGKFRRTALTFFGVRKNICILPSFFGGRSKNANKWSSKKGITKSKTHDGLTTVCHNDCLRGRCAAADDSESQREFSGELHACCHHECSHAEQKSLTLGRQKKGLRGLFNSFKHHRNNRNLGADRSETAVSIPSPHCKTEVPVFQRDDAHQYVTAECLGSRADVPDFADVPHDETTGAECSSLADTVALERSADQESLKSEFSCEACDVQMEEMSFTAVVSGDYEDGAGEPGRGVQTTPKAVAPNSEAAAAAGSSDQLNLMFGDVASLKSFDSLTGCGDIIADREDDSMTESSVCEERGRNGGKRASCYLTYQGGGEEMASPDDFNECLHYVWSATERTEELSSDNMDLVNSNSVQQASGMESSSMADVLTPQSEHQESVPNSDEGYYDSTTPGPEDGQEKDRQQADRLPRDSYSGDALYELFAPDESLISPHFENTSKLPGSKPCEYLTESVAVPDSSFAPGMDLLKMSSELYDVQTFLESGKSSEAQNAVSRQDTSSGKEVGAVSKPQGNKMSGEGEVSDEKSTLLPSNEKRSKAKTSNDEKRQSDVSFGSTSDPDFETFCEPKERHLEENKPVALPYRSAGAKPPDSDRHPDDGRTVCFSQALVDYTKHSQMLGEARRDQAEMSDAFTPNMEALPAIVTFDVVDMHNEGEYDQQIHMDLEEDDDAASPFQDFEQSCLLPTDALADLDFQMLDLYKQSVMGNSWAVASLPRRLGLTGAGHAQNPLSLDRRSRSLDTEGLESDSPHAYREERAAIVSHTQQDLEKDASPRFKRNVHALDAKDCSGIMALSWQTRSEMALGLPMTDGEIAEKVQSACHMKHKLFSPPPGYDFPDGKLQRLCSNVSDRASRGSAPQNAELYNRQCNPVLQSDTRAPHSTFAYAGMAEATSNHVRDDDDDDDDDVFCEAAINLPLYSQCHQSVAAAHRESLFHTPAPFSACKEEMVGARRDNACGKVSETTFN